jgi:uncharacterized OB-fold protein
MTNALPQPDITALNKPWWDALAAGSLTFQYCSCNHKWLPPRAHCPICLSSNWRWETASGCGILLSWVVFHVSYHEAFARRLPYNVAVVELIEGPRLVSSVINSPDGSGLEIGIILDLIIEQEDGISIPRFRKRTP